MVVCLVNQRSLCDEWCVCVCWCDVCLCELGCWFNFTQTFDKRTIYCKSFPIKFSHFHLLFLHFLRRLLPFFSRPFCSSLSHYTFFSFLAHTLALLAYTLVISLSACLSQCLPLPSKFFLCISLFTSSFLFVTWFSFDYQHAGCFVYFFFFICLFCSLLFRSCRNYYFILFILFIINLKIWY